MRTCKHQEVTPSETKSIDTTITSVAYPHPPGAAQGSDDIVAGGLLPARLPLPTS